MPPAALKRATAVASVVGNVAGEQLRAALGQDARGVERVLDRERHAVQGPKRRAAGDGLVGRIGARQRLFGHQGDDGVDLRVHRGDAVQVRLDHFTRGELLGADERRKRGRVLVMDGAGVCDLLHGHGHLLLCEYLPDDR